MAHGSWMSSNRSLGEVFYAGGHFFLHIWNLELKFILCSNPAIDVAADIICGRFIQKDTHTTGVDLLPSTCIVGIIKAHCGTTIRQPVYSNWIEHFLLLIFL